MAFTDFCCRSGGSNLNSGTRTGNSTEPGTGADFTYASGTWVAATRTFTPASGNPSTDGIAAGDFGSVYVDASALTGYVARVTSVTATTIVFSATVLSGTAPADGVATRTCKIGGAWKGPNAAENFPFGFITNALISAANVLPRVNFKNDANYNVTAAIAHANTQIRFEGYTTAYGDGGRATIDGGATGAAYAVLTNSGTVNIVKNLIVQNNGDSGNAAGITMSGARSQLEGCVAHDLRGFGIFVGQTPVSVIECEAYACNGSNTASQGGFGNNASASFIRCISHDNVGSNSVGFFPNAGPYFINCIADSNGSHGWLTSGNISFVAVGCDAYNNGGSGISSTVNGAHYIASCNFIKNGAYGVIGSTTMFGTLINNGFGAGTQANSSGTTNTLGMAVESGSVNYAANVTPWVDPENGDFRINLAAAQGTGRGTFTETAASYTGTVGYPDRGAAQHQEVATPFAGSAQ